MKKLLAVLSAACAFVAGISADVTLTGNGVNSSFKTIQEALASLESKEGSFTIKLPKGTYEEALYYNGPADITLSGDTNTKYGSDVVIATANTGDIYLLKEYTSSTQKGRCVFEFEGTGNLTLENLTVHNTFVRGSVKGSNTQAEAIGFDSTGNLAAYNCAFKSTQDTLRMTGKSWFYNCYVEGDTDFIWMESTGKVALFEECEIVSIYDEKHTDPTSYIGAPRMDIGTKAAKGLVILNSSISSQDGEKTFLARTPWNSGYYNQVAFVNNKITGKIEDSLWKGSALTAKGIPETIIGWKLDKTTAKNIGVDTKDRKDILSDDDVKKEFGGRESILNRYYDITTLKYKKDLDSYWDTKKFAKDHGWKVSKDSSKSLLSGEEKVKKMVYTFNEENPKANKDVKLEGFEIVGDILMGEAGAKITFPVKAKSVVSVTGCNFGNGTIKADNQGEAFYDFNTGSPAKFKETAYVIYKGSTNVTITASKKTAISKIVIESDKKVTFIPITGIKIFAEDNAKMVYGRKTLQFYAEINPLRPTNADFDWSVSDPSVATIAQDGTLTAANVTEDKEITVKAKAKDEKGASAEFKLLVSKPDPNAFSVTWLNSVDASTSLEGTSDNEEIAKASKAIPSAGTWKFNSSKINASFAKGGITYTGYKGSIEGKDVLYVDFPITAAETVEITEIEAAYGNHGTSNVAALIQGIVGGKKTEIVSDESRKARSAKKVYETSYTIPKGTTANIRVILYGRDGNGECAIASGKAPTIATITISGKKK